MSCENLLDQRESLVQYEPPIELSVVSESSQDRPLGREQKTNQPPLESKPDIENILNAVLPPMEWEQDGKRYIQYVSHNNASRADVAELQKELDDKLINRQARETGICLIREKLHSECYDEIIRQVTINCPERGLLLMRVRDELKLTIAAYQTLYKSANLFGSKKQIESEAGKKEIDEQIKFLQKRKSDLVDRRIELENKKRSIDRMIDENRNHEMGRKNIEVEYLTFQNENLRSFLANMIDDGVKINK